MTSEEWNEIPGMAQRKNCSNCGRFFYTGYTFGICNKCHLKKFMHNPLNTGVRIRNPYIKILEDLLII